MPSRPTTGCSTSETPTLAVIAPSSWTSSCADVPLLSRVGADRADQLRTDVDAATAGWAEAALLRVDSRNQVLVANGRVVLGAAAELGDKPPPEAVFLGRIEDGRHVWAIRGALQAPEDPDVQAEVVNLRSLGPIFDDTSSQLVSRPSRC